LRVGTPAVTTRGFGPAEITAAADWLADVVERPQDAAVAARVRAGARELLARFPVYAAWRENRARHTFPLTAFSSRSGCTVRSAITPKRRSSTRGSQARAGRCAAAASA